MELLRLLTRSSLAKCLLVFFVFLFGFWVWIYLSGFEEGSYNNFFGALYPFISLAGGLYGLLIASKKWGGMKSLMGKGIIFLSFGLLAEVFGQWAWSYYTIVNKVEIPYPSIADIGYFLIVPLYSYGMYNIAKVVGTKIGLKNFLGKLQTIVIPLLMVTIAYALFLKNVTIDSSNYLKTFLDFGYPGFEVIAISIGILTYSLSRSVLGGIMRTRVLYIIFALVLQYITDYTFLYQVGVGTYYNGGIVDLMYATSFLVMALGIISLNHLKEE